MHNFSLKAYDQYEIIKCMIYLGANVECFNDDGFTPLNLTLMRYICFLNDVKSWTEHLIPHVNLKFNIKKGKTFNFCYIINQNSYPIYQ